MLAPLQDNLSRVIARLESEFLGRQREFLVGLVAESFEKATLRLRARIPAPSPSVVARARARIAELLGQDLGVAVEVRILAFREIDARAMAPLIDAGNRIASKVLEGVAARRYAGAGPVFLFGPTGVGKSFLLERMLEACDQPASLWTGLSFFDTVAQKVRTNGVLGWRRSLLESSLFIIDEVHRLRGKRRAQIELRGLLDEYRARSAQVVLLGRHHPRQVRDFHSTLVSRFLGGMPVRVEAPLLETRRVYLERLGCRRKTDAVAFDRVVRTSRSYGALVRAAPALGANSVQADVGEPGLVRSLIERVAVDFGVRAAELTNRGRCRRLSVPRQVVVFLAREAGVSGAEISRTLGWRSTSASTYAMRCVEKRMENDPNFRHRVQSLR